MRILLQMLVMFSLVSGCAHPAPQLPEPQQQESQQLRSTKFAIDPQGLNGSAELYVEHVGGKMANWVGMNLPNEKLQNLRQGLRGAVGPLKDRGEAHITVISPVEFDTVLASHLTIAELHALARTEHLQNSQVILKCLGKGDAVVSGSKESTYYLVVESRELLQFRRDVLSLFVKHGGDPKLFLPEHFYPHVTLGFTARDLHEQDGVVKDAKSCVAEISAF